MSHGTCLPVKGVTAAMMDVVVRKSRAIRSIYEQDRALFLESEHGLIRIWPQTDRKTVSFVYPIQKMEYFRRIREKNMRICQGKKRGQPGRGPRDRRFWFRQKN